ncbi:FAS1 domain-containing protein [Dendryphion nanum]|uniref:FAS1 domain-containing protein n=1 Tax=Dendryphion nanum TaxID=256645 RepID=A0A9P9ELR2_9PLEO|nr:FAS1 domain-containing protein [Dendryphion nanum]
MQFKNLPLLALASLATAQEGGNQTQGLNQTLASQPNLSNLTQFLNLNPALIGALAQANNITILAPSDQAFARIANSSAFRALGTNPEALAALLTYHVLNGTYRASDITNTSAFVPTLLQNSSFSNVTGGQRVEAVRLGNQTVFYSGLLQNSTVTQANLNFTGGVIHVVDNLLTLPVSVSDTALAAGLTSLRGGLNQTNLTSTVNNLRDVTIFAPSNQAFQNVGSGLNIAPQDISNILQYHVINGTVGYSSGLRNGTSLRTVGGKNLTITIRNGTVFVNAARVITPNVLVANGVVHVIDQLLDPNNSTGPAANATTGAPAVPGSSVSNAPFTSGQPTPSTTINPTGGAGAASSTIARTTGSTAGAMPMKTGAVGAAALFGAAGALFAGF